MPWNYRLIEFMDDNGAKTHQAIHEVYYDKNMTPISYSINPATVISMEEVDIIEDLERLLDMMKHALSKECLTEDDFKNY